MSGAPLRMLTVEEKHERALNIPLFDLCKVDTPLIKRIPGVQRSHFASAWGRLLLEAVDTKSLSAWSDFFAFPKCILWSPTRGGRRIAKKKSMAELIRVRLIQWSNGDKMTLWRAAVERSKRNLVDPEELEAKKPTDQARLEARVISALRLGDTRKALQMLNSAPIAAKTEATLERMKKLHPLGDNPTPIPEIPNAVPHFTEDVVRSALCSFGPSSAAGLFGYKPLLLQQCVRAESFVFGRALTAAVNHFATGHAPSFLKRYVAGGVSIALEKSATAVPAGVLATLSQVGGQVFLRRRQG